MSDTGRAKIEDDGDGDGVGGDDDRAEIPPPLTGWKFVVDISAKEFTVGGTMALE